MCGRSNVRRRLWTAKTTDAAVRRRPHRSRRPLHAGPDATDRRLADYHESSLWVFTTYFDRSRAPVAQGIEHGSPKAGVAGSNPAGGTRQKLYLAVLRNVDPSIIHRL
ncbi:oligopeptidase B [Mycolicibacterium brisbanense]|uniref:Oligopeptidase B n=1 Tax=Mycolicibacterium brisbanense TaxID=146020 RepID=A0A100VV40_9MYCO|nr:oligopeptidase B [Mycolicibacterium brisbanense]